MKLTHCGIALKLTKPENTRDWNVFLVTISNSNLLPEVNMDEVTKRAKLIKCQQSWRKGMPANQMAYHTNTRPYTPYELAAFLASLAESIALLQ